MVIVKKYGESDYFITMTCNLHCSEIFQNLRPSQTSLNVSHLVSCLFRQYLKGFINHLQGNGILGRGIARIHVIELEKQGYPQEEIVLAVQQVEKLHDVRDDESAISAEISNREELPLLQGTASSPMMYCPCGADNRGNVCMRGNKCSKDSSKHFRDHTGENTLGYPKYQRRHNGTTVEKSVPGKNKPVLLDNQLVVPYNPYLSQKSNYHINVKVCVSVVAVLTIENCQVPVQTHLQRSRQSKCSDS